MLLRRFLLGSASLSVLAVAFPALAQEGGVTQLDTVTTVATRTPKSIFETIGSVSTVNQEEIERRMPSTFGDIVKSLPNVDLSGGPRPMGQQLNIRGFGEDRVVLRFDGARNNFGAGHRGRLFVDPDLIRQVEVLRGPGTTYGSGALGGAVQVEFKNAEDFLDPDKTWGFRSKFGVQSANDEFMHSHTLFGRITPLPGFGQMQGLVSFTRRISSDIEAGPSRYDRSSINDRIAEVPYSGENSKAGLVKWSYDPSPNARILFTYTNFNDRVNIPANADGDFNTTSAPLVRRQTNDYRYIWGFNYKTKETGWVDLQARAYYNQIRLDERVIQGAASTLNRHDETDLTTVGIDVANTSRFSFAEGKVKSALTYGVEWYYDDLDGRRNGGPRAGYPNSNGYNTGVYIQNEITLFDQFILLGALRWDSFQFSSAGRADYSRDRLSKTGGLGWRPTDWLMIYGKYSEGFRAPNLATELFLNGPHFPGNVFVPNPNLRPEISRTIEFGGALQFRNVVDTGDRVYVKGAVFRSNVKDYIDFNLTPAFFQAVNVPEARVFGAEVEAGYTSRYFFGSIAASYVIGENVTTGNSLSTIPAQKLVATIGGRLPEWDLVAGFRLNVNSDQNRVPPTIFGSGVFGPGPPVTFAFQTFAQTSGYTTGDLFISWAPSGKYITPLLKGFRVDAGIDNIWDKRYRRPLSIYPEAGINYKLAISYTAQF